ncbi:hypothetical protein Tco_0832930, partial [Tanacetum coccineum]
MPTGKIGVYTRFFGFANFRLPLSTFLVDVLRYYRIYISQLSVIVAAKNKGWMSFSKHLGHDAVCYTKPLDSLKGWNDHFFWVDAFACPASFSWHMGKSVSKDPFPQSNKFNAEHYASLVAYLAPFHKYREPFLCLVGISRYYTLDENTYPKDGFADFYPHYRPYEGCVVPLLPAAPSRGESELKDRVDRLFDEEGNDDQAEQGDSASGGQGVGIQPVSGAVETNIKGVVLRRQEKRKSMIVDSDEPSHPAKKLRKDHGIPVGTFVAGKSIPAIQRLLAGARGVHRVGLVGFGSNSAPQRLIISSNSSHHSSTHIVETEVDSLIRSSALSMTTATTVNVTVGAATVVKEAIAKPSLFATGSSSVGGTESILVGFSDLTGNDFLV